MTSCPLDDVELESILSGEATPEVEAHLRHCEICCERLKELLRDELPIKRLLFRAPCPTPEDLAKWYLGWLMPDDTEQICRHVEACPLCQQEVRIQAETLDLPVHSGPDDREPVRRIVAQRSDLLPQAARVLRGGLVVPGASGTAGGRYHTEQYGVLLDVEQRSSVRYMITGFIVHDVDKLGQFDGATAILKRGRQVLDHVQVDDVDTFVFADVLCQTYTIELELGSTVVVIEQFALD